MRAAALGIVALFGCTSADPDGPQVTGHGAVTVHVTASRQDAPGVRVVFDGPDGALAGTATTDPTGRATGELDTPGMVTIVDPDDPMRLLTVTDLEPGELVELALDRPSYAAPVIGTITVLAPTSAPPAGTDHYAFQTPCGDSEASSFPATVPIRAGCSLDGVPVIITAQEPPGSLEYPGHALAYAAGITDASGTLAPGAWSTQCTQVNVQTNPVMSLNLHPRLGGEVFFYAYAEYCPLAAPPSGFSAYPVLDFGEGALGQAFAYVTGSLRLTMMFTSYAALPDSVSVEQSRDLLVGDVGLARLDEHGAAWTRDPALASADLVDARLTWTLGTSQYVQWRFITPNWGYVTVPQLPATDQWALASATERAAELHFLAADWTNDRATLHTQLADLDNRRLPTGGTLLDYIEQFYPDAGN